MVKTKSEYLRFEYINWEGKRGVRKAKPIRIWFGETKFHKGNQWFLKAIDPDKREERDFALKDIIKFLE